MQQTRWLYLASVLDLGSRRLLGYSMASHMRTELVADALKMAVTQRNGVTGGIIFHGDRGSEGGFNRIHLTRFPEMSQSEREAPLVDG